MNYDQVDKYRKRLEDDIYTTMEFSRQSYPDVINMPVQRMYNYLRWKSLHEQKKKDAQDKAMGKVK